MIDKKKKNSNLILNVFIAIFFTILLAYLVFALVDHALINSPATGSNHSSDFSVNVSYLNFSEWITAPKYENTTCYINTSGVWTEMLNSSVYTIANDSISFNVDITNVSDGKYFAINCSIGNTTDSLGPGSFTNLTYDIIIDDTPPNVSSFQNTVNGGNYSASSLLNINVTVDDVTMGMESVWFNLTNATEKFEMNWSQAKPDGIYYNYSLNISSIPDGDYNITVLANDTLLGNLNNSESVQITIDSTKPTVSSLTKSSSTASSLTISVSVGDGSGSGKKGACSVSRSGASVSGGGTTSQTITETGLTCGTSYSYTVTCSDYAGNSGSKTESFTTDNCGSAATTNGGGVSSWTGGTTTIVNNEQFTEGFTKELKEKDRFKVEIENSNHYVGITELTSNTAKIEVSSTPQSATLSVGDTRKFDVTEDNYYDVQVTLNSISNNKADITLKSIYEEVTEETIEEEQEKEEATTGTDEEEIQQEKANLAWLWIVIVLIIIVGIIVYIIYKKKKFNF